MISIKSVYVFYIHIKVKNHSYCLIEKQDLTKQELDKKIRKIFDTKKYDILKVEIKQENISKINAWWNKNILRYEKDF